MLIIEVPGDEWFDEESNQFFSTPGTPLVLEHSLVSLSKWETIWEVPFLGADDKTDEQKLSYVKCMILTQGYDESVLYKLTADHFAEIDAYVAKKMTATWFSEPPKKPGPSPIITSEIFYYWMLSLNIPMECENWHLNRLITLVRVCNQKNSPETKMSKSELAQRHREINARRKRELGTTG